MQKHDICATGTTAGKFVEEATGLKIDAPCGWQGGEEQISARVAYNEIDLVLFSVIRCPTHSMNGRPCDFRLCDMRNIPIATNSATAEMLILGLDRGDLDWRNIVNPKNKNKQ